MCSNENNFIWLICTGYVLLLFIDCWEKNRKTGNHRHVAIDEIYSSHKYILYACIRSIFYFFKFNEIAFLSLIKWLLSYEWQWKFISTLLLESWNIYNRMRLICIFRVSLYHLFIDAHWHFQSSELTAQDFQVAQIKKKNICWNLSMDFHIYYNEIFNICSSKYKQREGEREIANRTTWIENHFAEVSDEKKKKNSIRPSQSNIFILFSFENTYYLYES